MSSDLKTEKIRLVFFIQILLILAILLFSPFLYAKNIPFKSSDFPRLVETWELSSLLNHPSIRIVDMRSSLPDYLKAHIPNAVYLNFQNLQMPIKGIPAQTPDRAFLERLLGENLSLSNDMWVIIYSERSNPNATLLAWNLDFLGHKKIGILNGGWEKWVSEKLSLTKHYPSLIPKKFFGKVIRETLADKKRVSKKIKEKNTVIVDARPPEQYSGKEGDEIRRGHIPGAINIFWEKTLEGDDLRIWKKREEIKKIFSENNITEEREVIVYCGTGMDASHLYFTLKYVQGFTHVRLYRGSWLEWSSDLSLPIKLGAEP